MRATLFYDDTCGFCSACISFLKKRNANLDYVGISRAKLPVRLRNRDSLILKDKNKYYIYSDAAIRSISLIGGIYKFSSIGYICPKIMRDYLYKKIAKKRHCLL